MKIKQALQEYLLEIEIRKYTPKTIRSYRNNLNLFVRYLGDEAELFDTEDLSLASVKMFSQYMVKRGKKGRYINGLLKTAKSFIQYCYDEGYGGFNTKKNFKWCKEEKVIITTFTPNHVRQMMQSCNGNDYLSIRDKAILFCFADNQDRKLEQMHMILALVSWFCYNEVHLKKQESIAYKKAPPSRTVLFAL